MFIDTVWRIMANNYYSIIINGKRYGFFHCKRGLKQGDTLSPAYFFRSTCIVKNSQSTQKQSWFPWFLYGKEGYNSEPLMFWWWYHFVLFKKGQNSEAHHGKTLKLIMQTLKYYEDISNEMVDGDKRHFMIHPNAFDTTRDRIKRITGFKQKQGPITYLGCPLFLGKPRIVLFSDLGNFN